jgi:hypothetical protein
MAVLLEKEDAEWKWSPLFCAIRKLPDLPLRYRGRPFAHTAPELQDIISWASEQILPQFETLPVPEAVLPLKRISRTAVGPHVALAWPRNYTNQQQFLEEYKAEFKFATADVITFGRVYFPGLPLPIPELEAIRDGVDAVMGNISDPTQKCIDAGIRWLEQLTIRGVVDMMRAGGLDHLTAMWTLGAGLPRQQCLDTLGRTILLRENATLKWIFGSFDSLSEFPDSLEELETCAARVAKSSEALCVG